MLGLGAVGQMGDSRGRGGQPPRPLLRTPAFILGDSVLRGVASPQDSRPQGPRNVALFGHGSLQTCLVEVIWD